MRGLWLQEALAGVEAAPPLEGAVTADVCIVGGGYTGLWAALHIKDLAPAADVVLLERDICGSGASGRNNGQVLDWWAKMGTFANQLGVTEALRLGRLAEQAVVEIGRFCEVNDIKAGFHRAGWLWAASNEAQLGAWAPTVGLLARHGINKFRPVDREEAVSIGGSPRLLGGVLQENVAVVQPAQLVLGLRAGALARGVRIFEHSPITRVDRERPARVWTRHGVVSADRVVLAMNAWLSRFPEPARSMFVVGSDMAASEPIPERLEAAGLTSGVPLTDSRMLLRYARATPDGRITAGLAGTALVGPRGGDGVLYGPPTPPRVRRLAESLRFLFPALSDVPLTRCWTGPVDRSWSGLPFFGFLQGSPHIRFCAGFSGNGVGPAHLAGRALASQALDREDEWAHVAHMLRAIEGMPPEPVRYLGGRLVRAAVARRERLQDDGRRVDPVTTALARIAPAAVVPMDARSSNSA